MAYVNIVVDREGPVGLVTLNRPKVLNALNQATMDELVDALEGLDGDDEIRCVVLTGAERAFAAGADVTEMVEATPADRLAGPRFLPWGRVRKIRQPLL